MKYLKLFEEFGQKESIPASDYDGKLGEVDSSCKGEKIEYIDDIESYRRGKEVKKEGTIKNKFIQKDGKVFYNIVDDESGKEEYGVPESHVFFNELHIS